MHDNRAMKLLLAEHGVDPEMIDPADDYPIWQKQDLIGRPYWGVLHFWNLNQASIDAGRDLALLEWAGNEVNLDANTPAEIPEILRKAIGVMKAWKDTLQQAYEETPFILFASCDDGAELVHAEDHPDGFFSVTLRFWAPRNSKPVLDFEAFDDWAQPAILEFCNMPDALPFE